LQANAVTNFTIGGKAVARRSLPPESC